MSFGWEEDANDFLSWRANVTSKGRALLMLFLFSEVGEHDAPTRIRVGSHRSIARRLAPAGEAGLTLRELAATGFAESAGCAEVLATGSPGTVYLCHPFLVHAAQLHHGARPRLMAQPPLLPKAPLQLSREDGAYSPVEQSIREALTWARSRRRLSAIDAVLADRIRLVGVGRVRKLHDPRLEAGSVRTCGIAEAVPADLA